MVVGLLFGLITSSVVLLFCYLIWGIILPFQKFKNLKKGLGLIGVLIYFSPIFFFLYADRLVINNFEFKKSELEIFNQVYVLVSGVLMILLIVVQAIKVSRHENEKKLTAVDIKKLIVGGAATLLVDVIVAYLFYCR